MKSHAIPFIILLMFAGCSQRKKVTEKDESQGVSIPIKYAKGFTATRIGNSILAEVTYPFQGATSGYKYLLVPKGEPVPPNDQETRVIYTPLESIVCTSTTHIPLLDYLGETDRLVGFPTTDYISSEKMRKRVDEGKVTDLGIDKGLNLEKLAVLNPDAVMGYTMSGDYGQFRTIESLGIPVVINGEYLEHHPLGRAEWIKFMALFFHREREADSVFQVIEQNYMEAMAAVPEARDTLAVMSGILYGDAWFLPAGENYAAILFRDAGYHYLWRDSPGNGFLRLPLESVYEKAHDADLWIGTGSYKTLQEIKAADIRYTSFKPFRDKAVYNYDARQGAKGGNEFLELGYLRPDLILRDLVKIAYPQSLPEHRLFFHRKLE